MTRTSRTASVSLTVTLAAGLLLTGCSFDDGPKKTASADATVTEAITAVDVSDARSGSIEVTPGTGPGVTVRRTVHYRGDTVPEPAQRVSGGVLTLTNGTCSDSCSVDYRLEVPASAKVTLDSSSGDITVAGVAAAEIETSSGSVRADRIAGPLKISTSSGPITAENLGAPSVDAHSDSGDVRLVFPKAPNSVAVETTSGDATVQVPPAPYRVDIDTSSGSREITVPTDPAAPSHLSVKTTSGDVRISRL
ncbi:DUF4097 family beta strand repeat-containing protein [Streptomyces sp. NBC_01268]|uniref:DUF4097 family beta strand repeat-containing protein n=1 Tax=Streptomyces sp. NBC_01268 TaxID=2903806 RepID=UPI002E327E36|nr:DUF4097 family beta strand repeat-containing protein [Streptomyces sp. NBC_01268]